MDRESFLDQCTLFEGLTVKPVDSLFDLYFKMLTVFIEYFLMYFLNVYLLV